MNKGEIAISRQQSANPKTNGLITIVVNQKPDAATGTRYKWEFEIVLTPEQFANAITGMITECEYTKENNNND